MIVEALAKLIEHELKVRIHGAARALETSEVVVQRIGPQDRKKGLIPI